MPKWFVALFFILGSVAISQPTLSFAEETQEESSNKETYGKTNGILGSGAVIGPSATLLAIPRLFAVGLESKFLEGRFGGAFNYSFVPSITIKDSKLEFNAWDVRLKWYPGKSAMFWGVAIGQQSLTGTKSDTISGVATTVTVDLDTLFVTPHIGWNWTWDSGFFMGMDIGLQLAASRDTTVTTNITNTTITNSQEYRDLESKVKDAGDTIGKIPLPMFTFLKVGFFF